MTNQYASRRPARTSSLLAVVVSAAVVVALSGPRVSVGQWVVAELVGLGAVAAGVLWYRGGRRGVGAAVVLVGVAVAAGALAGFAAGSPAPAETVRLLPGLLGLAVLTAALVPVRDSGARWLVKAGAGGLFAAVVLAGLFEAAPLTVLLGTAVGAIVAWDSGEHAIGVGEQLGTRASTWRCELPHIAATALVGVVGSVAVVGVRSVANDGLSLPAFVMVFLAVVLLVAALRY